MREGSESKTRRGPGPISLFAALLVALAAVSPAMASPEDDRCARNEARAEAAMTAAAEVAPPTADDPVAGPETSLRAGDRLATPLKGGLINLDTTTARVTLKVGGRDTTYVGFVLFDKPPGQWNCQRIGLRMAWLRAVDEPQSPFLVVRVRDRPFGLKGPAREAQFLIDRKTGELGVSTLEPPFALLKTRSGARKDLLETIKIGAAPLIASRQDYEFALQRQVLKKLRTQILTDAKAVYGSLKAPISVGRDNRYFIDAFEGLEGDYKVIHRMIIGGELGLDSDNPAAGGPYSVFTPGDAIAAGSGLSIGPYQADIDQNRWERPLFLSEMQFFLADHGYRISAEAVENVRNCFYLGNCRDDDELGDKRGIRRYTVSELYGYQQMLPIAVDYLQDQKGRAFVIALHETFLIGALRCLATAYRALPDTLTPHDRALIALNFVDGFNQHGPSIGMAPKGIYLGCAGAARTTEFLACAIDARARRAGTTATRFRATRFQFIARAADAFDPEQLDAQPSGMPSQTNPTVAALRRRIDPVASDGKGCAAAAALLNGRFTAMSSS